MYCCTPVTSLAVHCTCNSVQFSSCYLADEAKLKAAQEVSENLEVSVAPRRNSNKCPPRYLLARVSVNSLILCLCIPTFRTL